MKMPTYVHARSTPRLLALMLAVSMCGCATVSQAPQKQKAESANASPPLPGTQIIPGEDLRDNGRTNNDESLRALSPIFH